MSDAAPPQPASTTRPGFKLPGLAIPGTKYKVPGWSLLIGAGAVAAWLLLSRRGSSSAAATPGVVGDFDVRQASAAPVDAGAPPELSVPGPVVNPSPAPMPSATSLAQQIASTQQRLKEIKAILADPDLHRQGNEGFLYTWQRRYDAQNARLQQLLAQQAQGITSGGPDRNWGMNSYPERWG